MPADYAIVNSTSSWRWLHSNAQDFYCLTTYFTTKGGHRLVSKEANDDLKQKMVTV